jgi:hypothetical protein
LEPFVDFRAGDLEYGGPKEGGEGHHVIRLHDPFPMLVRMVGVDAEKLERLEGDYTLDFYVTATGVPVGADLLAAARIRRSASVTAVEAQYAFADWGAPIVITAPAP